MTASNPNQPTQPASYQRGDIWMVDFGQSVGTEMGMEHPALIVSVPEIRSCAQKAHRSSGHKQPIHQQPG